MTALGSNAFGSNPARVLTIYLIAAHRGYAPVLPRCPDVWDAGMSTGVRISEAQCLGNLSNRHVPKTTRLMKQSQVFDVAALRWTIEMCLTGLMRSLLYTAGFMAAQEPRIATCLTPRQDEIWPCWPCSLARISMAIRGGSVDPLLSCVLIVHESCCTWPS